jgi:quercetin dioxygenase-like cupin family protein
MSDWMNMLGRRAVATGLALVTLTIAAAAQKPAFTRTEVQRGDLSVSGKEVVQAVADIPAGVSAGRHTHPGEEVAYVLEGTVLVEIDGKPAATLKAGQGVIIPAGAVHNATNKSSAGAKVLATYIIDKGKPVATPVK